MQRLKNTMFTKLRSVLKDEHVVSFEDERERFQCIRCKAAIEK